jgi:hypothetical protein
VNIIYVVTFRYGSRVFVRAFTEKKRADSRAFRIKQNLGVTADVVRCVLDGPDGPPERDKPAPDDETQDFPRPNGAC